MQDPTLYIVSTPIGTLGDLSPRAREVLAQVDFVACEDTRHSGKLLSHFGIRARLESLHAHNETDKSAWLIEKLLNSEKRAAALVSDAGTPAISDPGSQFVALARAQGVRILSVPGPSALTSALAASGFRAPRTLFIGFLDRNKTAKKEEFGRWRLIAPAIAVFFESPQRIAESLRVLAECLPGVEVCVSREISKLHEEHIVKTVEEALQDLDSRPTVQGEFVVSVFLDSGRAEPTQPRLSLEQAAKILLGAENADNLPLKERVKKIALENALSARDLYNKVQELKNGVD